MKEFNIFNIPYDKNTPLANPFIDISDGKYELKNTPIGVDTAYINNGILSLKFVVYSIYLLPNEYDVKHIEMIIYM